MTEHSWTGLKATEEHFLGFIGNFYMATQPCYTIMCLRRCDPEHSVYILWVRQIGTSGVQTVHVH